MLETTHRLHSLEIRLATGPAEILAAQALRYRVFYEEMSAVADSENQHTSLDKDAYDAFCDHLIILDHERTNEQVGGTGSGPAVIGTYRLMPQAAAEKKGGFYSAGEYNIDALLKRKGTSHKFLELGRSCVLKPYRNSKVLELLWRGIWSYVRNAGLNVMIGCASFAGTDPDALALPLSFLHHNCLAPADWRVKALPARYVDMNRLPNHHIEARKAIKMMPPLIKSYLRLGAYVGEGAVIDEQFGTTDILIILPNSRIPKRYLTHFGEAKRGEDFSSLSTGNHTMADIRL